MRSIRQRLKERARSVPLGEDAGTLVATLNRTLEGWANYFRHGHASADFRKVDAQARTQVRIWLMRKHGGKGRGVRRYPATFLNEHLRLVMLSYREVALSRPKPNAVGEVRRAAVCGKTARTVG